MRIKVGPSNFLMNFLNEMRWAGFALLFPFPIYSGNWASRERKERGRRLEWNEFWLLRLWCWWEWRWRGEETNVSFRWKQSISLTYWKVDERHGLKGSDIICELCLSQVIWFRTSFNWQTSEVEMRVKEMNMVSEWNNLHNNAFYRPGRIIACKLAQTSMPEG